MAKVLGVGGVFFKVRDKDALMAWYGKVLGLDVLPYGIVVFTPAMASSHAGAATVFSAFAADSDYFDPSTRDFMVNLMVDDLDGMVARCKEHGVQHLKVLPDEPNGRFAHLMDPEGIKIELWQPKPDA